MQRNTQKYLVISTIAVLGLAIQPQADATKNNATLSPEIHSQLNLSDEQLGKIQELRNNQQRQVQAREKAMQVAQNEFRQALRSHASDEELKQQFQALQAARSELSRTRFQQMLQLRGVLTDDQQKKFREIKATRNDPDGG